MDGAWLVVGLGNPGPKYASTRHNLGFMVVDRLAGAAGADGWREKFNALTARALVDGVPLLLIKPQTFMNLSGRSAARAAVFHRVEPDRIIVVHDDLDLEFGVVRVKIGGGTGGHKGIASCKADMGTGDFLRVRMGIGRPARGDATDYVLEAFSTDERATLLDFVELGARAVTAIVKDGATAAMNAFNVRIRQREE